MSPRYAVIGNPVAHSLSPEIHAAFSTQTGLDVDYRRVTAPIDAFASNVDAFFADGGRGLNVTVPFKLEASALCGDRSSERARRAGAVNWLVRDDDGLRGDNTDGIGLLDDLVRLTGDSLNGARVLLLGAGGAARGVLGPLLDAGPASLVVVNRDARKADALLGTCAMPAQRAMARATGYDDLSEEAFDIVINATSVSLAGDVLPLPPSTFAKASLVYDMMYGAMPTSFMTQAARAGARRTADGLGMLVGQAAESFFLWRGVRPETAPVLAMLRALLAAKA